MEEVDSFQRKTVDGKVTPNKNQRQSFKENSKEKEFHNNHNCKTPKP
jgi:hypothetical protein